MYDQNNIFARLLRGDIPLDILMENTHTLAFHDKYPKAVLHILIIPKGPYTNFSDFTKNATKEEHFSFYTLIQEIIEDKKLEEKGYRLITNCNDHGGQEVPHFHMHLLAGEPLGPLVFENYINLN
jgi:diadenosine tetraphosphate (Ap4A) HIT family hydrolase